ncbi:DUF305 domain-containing protein [Actinoalloteichus caeruleus]|uniref:Uncharacterized conserved protein, DUF305 family n=1 Tax=Actinoalloteichus caeruleus DSM 43889 TaxID=1120930 RepID=A0ABT1JR83_ACTCY|nr:DUF305 domain-containing protein [Actinoalloteichus caeruleus]MCP2334651.1 Uncharacterized conserved protein, DUF305 family [Actinoalloteichus caeruleus DSM 43889]
MTTRFPLRLVLTSAAAAVGLALTGCSDGGQDTGSGTTGGDTAPNAADIEFARDMVPHQRQALEMADLAPEHTENAEIQELADRIEGTQRPELDQLTSWLEEWDEEVPEDGAGGDGSTSPSASAVPPHGLLSEDELGRLAEAEGDEFDQLWLSMMLINHQGGVDLAQAVLDEGESPEVAELAERVLNTQQAEIDEMQTLLPQG